MTQTPRYALPLLQAGQAQKEVTHNAAVAQLDALLHLVAASRTVATPPATGTAAAWIVPAAATDVWTGRGGQIAALDDAGWTFIVPRDGCVAFVQDEQGFVYWSSGAWHDSWPVRSLSIAGRPMLGGALTVVPPPTGGTTVDVQARAALATLTAALQTLGLLAGS